MIRYRGVVVYADGRREPFEVGIRGARAWEAYASRHGYPLTPTKDALGGFPVSSWQLVLAHAALRVKAGVDAWAEDVDGVDDFAADDVVPPTPPEATPA